MSKTRDGLLQEIILLQREKHDLIMELIKYRRENDELRRKMSIPIPGVNFRGEVVPSYSLMVDYFTWRMEPIMFRVMLPVGVRREDINIKRTYKEMVKLIRKNFLETMRLNGFNMENL